MRDLEGSLQRLRTSSIFLYQLHGPPLSTISRAEVFEVLEEFRGSGLIHWYGVSIDEPEEGVAAIDACQRHGFSGLATLQVIYSLVAKQGRDQLFKAAANSGIAVIAREVLARGFLTDKYSPASDFSNAPSAVRKLLERYGATQLLRRAQEVRESANRIGLTTAQAALCFAMHHPSVTVTLAGMNRLAYVAEDCGALTASLPGSVLDSFRTTPDATVLESREPPE